MSIRKNLKVAAIGTAMLYTPILVIHALCLFGFGWRISGVELIILVPLGAMLGLPIAFVGLPFERFRPQATTLGLFSGLLLVTFVPVMLLAGELRSQGFERAAQRARPVVAAVERFVASEGRPPENLDHLIPEYLTEMPPGLPPLEVNDWRERPEYGNRWSLSAMVNSGFLNWDMFLYFPNGNYPQYGYGGRLELIEEWAYVHE